MPAPTPLPFRQAILRRHRRGETATHIAQALGLTYRTVRQLLRRWRDDAGPVLVPAYRQGGWPRTAKRHQLYDQILALRREHPIVGSRTEPRVPK